MPTANVLLNPGTTPPHAPRQGNDVGTQYRSIILYHSEEQRRQAQEVMDEVGRGAGRGVDVAAVVLFMCTCACRCFGWT